MKKISVLGSTGSIGTQCLEVIRTHREDFRVCALTGNNNTELLARQVEEFSPGLVCVYNPENEKALKSSLQQIGYDKPIKITTGMDGLIEAAVCAEAEIVLTAVVGMVGIRPTVQAIRAGKDIALANKETLVCAGKIIMSEAEKYGVHIYPVDSEHSAIFQSLNGENKKYLDKIILTASGGPFRGKKREELSDIKPGDALKHPNWSMGKKVTIDSSTLANKGLEVMEARWLFDVPASRIQVVIQPQSIIHSAVQYTDGSIIAQLGTPDMKLPIQYALYYPERPYLPGKRVDFFELSKLTFEKPDMETFKALRLAYEALDAGGSMPCVFNAANEVAVREFLAGRISYLGISDFIEKTMNAHKTLTDPCLDDIIKIGEDIIG